MCRRARGWFGPLSSVSGATVSVANATGNYTGGVMIVLAGAGAGQWRRILQQRGNSYVLEAALDPTPEPDTNVTVVPFRSHMLLTGNTIVNGTTMQLCVARRTSVQRVRGLADSLGVRASHSYGTSLNCIMADNTAHVMGSGFSAHGESYVHGWCPPRRSCALTLTCLVCGVASRYQVRVVLELAPFRLPKLTTCAAA